MKKCPAILLSLCFLSMSIENPSYASALSIYGDAIKGTGNIAQDSALEKAKGAIQAYFNAMLTNESTLSPNMAMATATEAVPEKDQASLQDYYSQVSLVAAKQAVKAYARKVTAGEDASNAEDSMHEIEDALSPDNGQEIKLYYDQLKKTNPKMV